MVVTPPEIPPRFEGVHLNAALRFVRDSGKYNMYTEFQKALAAAYVLIRCWWGMSTPEYDTLYDISHVCEYMGDYMRGEDGWEAFYDTIPCSYGWLKLYEQGLFNLTEDQERCMEALRRRSQQLGRGIQRIIVDTLLSRTAAFYFEAARTEQTCALEDPYFEPLFTCTAGDINVEMTGADYFGYLGFERLFS